MRHKRTFLFAGALGVLSLCAVALIAAQERRDAFVPASATLEAKYVFHAGEEEAATYRFGGNLAKPIFWPLKLTDKLEVTRAWPMRPAKAGEKPDHIHQKSAWFTYGDVIPEGISIKSRNREIQGLDFWAEGKDCGRIVCVRTENVTHEGNRAALTTYNEWRTPEGEKIMDEVRKIQFFGYESARLLIVDSDLHASVVPITFGDTKEGAFGVRVADSMREDRGKGHITNAEGKVGEAACWGRISDWCDYSGPVEEETVGIAIFASPDNPIPTCWHSRGYGLMAANPFGRAKSGFPAMRGKRDKKDLVHVDKGEHLKLRYAIFLHRGDVKEGKVAEAYELFKKMK